MPDKDFVYFVGIPFVLGCVLITVVGLAQSYAHEQALEHATQIKAELIKVYFETNKNSEIHTILTFIFNNTTMQVTLDGYQTSYAGHIGDYYIIKIYDGQVLAIEQVDDGGKQDENSER